VAREPARYKLDLVVVQEFRWDKGGTVRAGIILLYMEKDLQEVGWAVCTGLLRLRIGTGCGLL
jgi:hypothetical protein